MKKRDPNMQTYDAFSVEKYEYQGKPRRKFHKIGRMIQNKDGEAFSLYIPNGIAISGHIFIAPVGQTEDQLMVHYKCAADQFGL
ncbi:MAG: hypothetical protein IH606_16580 [Burkholderiales bacterium]|nr:hypothetical protein [Burkholderiales bacterium]